MEQQESINKTAALEALSQYLNNPRRTVIQVEAFTTGIILLLLLQIILGSFRRQSTCPVVQQGTWVTYVVSFPAIAYTLGLMQSSPVKNAMYPVWAVSSLMAAGCTNAVRVYELSDNRQWRRSIFNFIQYAVYAMVICWLLFPYAMTIVAYSRNYFQRLSPQTYFASFKTPELLIASLCSTALYTGVMSRELGCLMVEFGYATARKVSNFIKNLPSAADGDGDATMIMRGYKYPVHSPQCSYFSLGRRAYAWPLNLLLPMNLLLPIIGPDVTIDQIWDCECEGRLLSSGTDHCERLRDTCVAFTMYHQIKQRYYGMALTEKYLDGTRDFFLLNDANGLLRIEAGCERAFRIVEMELGFCYDYFFTKHAIVFEGEIAFLILFFLRLLLIPVFVSFVVQSKLSIKIPTAIIEVQTSRADEIITLLVLATVLLVEILQVVFYLASDWCKVSVTCRYVSSKFFLRNGLMEKLIRLLSRFRIFGYWKNRIGQYSVSGFFHPDLSGGDLETVKQAIRRSLVSCGGEPTNGKEFSRAVLEEFSPELDSQSQAEIMLIWNVATHYCDVSGDEEQDTESLNKKVSISLSRYCAYLMKCAPELLPGNFGDTKSAVADVQADFSEIFLHPTIQDMGGLLQEEGQGGSIIRTGVKLGKHLKASANCWGTIAGFWAEQILYIAQTNNVKEHMELLAKGGEFLTHIWVLLSHVGNHDINKCQPSGENV